MTENKKKIGLFLRDKPFGKTLYRAFMGELSVENFKEAVNKHLDRLDSMSPK